eukprot:COSAG02_NODE_11675_length_1676_cov_1.379201_3_plen_266_part_00
MEWASTMLQGLVGTAAEPQPQQQRQVGDSESTAAGDACTATAVDASVELVPAASPGPVESPRRNRASEDDRRTGSAHEQAAAAKEAGNGAFKAEDYEAAIAHYKKALRILASEAGPKAFGAGAAVLVRPAPGSGGGAPQKRQRNGGLRYAMVMCDDAAASTVDVEYLPSALTDAVSESHVVGEEEDDVDVARCEPLYSSETGAAALQLSLHMNWARCLKALKRPNDGPSVHNPAKLKLTTCYLRLRHIRHQGCNHQICAVADLPH